MAWNHDDTTGAKVGDRTQHPAGMCPEVAGRGYVCTANPDHAGPHVAEGVRTLHFIWSTPEDGDEEVVAE